MKAILLIALAFVCAQAFVGSFTPQDTNSFLKNADMQALLDFGRNEVAIQATLANKINAPILAVLKINSVATQVVAGMNVKFNVDLIDVNGEVYNVDMVLFVQSWTNTKSLVSYSINH